MYPYLHQFGGVGIASQSGTYVTQILPYLAKLQIGFSQAFSVGNGADLDLVDCLEYLAEDPETKAIAVYIEGIKRPRDFIQAASKASQGQAGRGPVCGRDRGRVPVGGEPHRIDFRAGPSV